MAPRLQLQSLLETFCDHVYFQTPTNITLAFPCIRYVRDGSKVKYADDRKYDRVRRYQVTVIDRNPDSSLPDQVEDLQFCTFDRWFAADNLNHWVFTLFF